MAERAQVQSVEAIEAFRVHLIVYLDKVRPLIDEVGSDLRRTLLWMETDRRLHWEREVRRRTRALEAAQQALLSARIATFQEVTVVEQQAVHAARHALTEAEDKLQLLRRWIRDFGPRTETLARQVGNLDSIVSQDLPKAVASLTQLVRHLEAYAETRTLVSDPAPTLVVAAPRSNDSDPPDARAATAPPAARPLKGGSA